jgi:hypothetical protein
VFLCEFLSNRGRLFPWARTRPNRDRFSHPEMGGVAAVPQVAGFIIATNDGA